MVDDTGKVIYINSTPVLLDNGSEMLMFSLIFMVILVKLLVVEYLTSTAAV